MLAEILRHQSWADQTSLPFLWPGRPHDARRLREPASLGYNCKQALQPAGLGNVGEDRHEGCRWLADAAATTPVSQEPSASGVG